MESFVAQFGNAVDLFAPFDRKHHQTGTYARDDGLVWSEAPFLRYNFSWLVRMNENYN